MGKLIRSENIDRIRRQNCPPQKLTKITLMHGPAGPGINVDLPVYNDHVRYGGWLWSWAGKRTPEGRHIFAKVPTARKLWRLIFSSIGQTGKDPRLNDRPQPFKYTEKTRPMKHKRGHIRRTTARGNNV
jgi:hypothetical protein